MTDGFVESFLGEPYVWGGSEDLEWLFAGLGRLPALKLPREEATVSLTHLVSGSANQSNQPLPIQYNSVCNQFQAGDTCTNGTYKSDVTCPVCYDILIGRAAAPCGPFGMS